MASASASPPKTILVSSGGHVYNITLSTEALLDRYSSASLQEISRKLLGQSKGAKGSKSVVLQRLVSHLLDPQKRKADFAALSADEKLLLSLITQDGREAYSSATLLALSSGSGISGDGALLSLVKSAFLMAINPRVMVDLQDREHLLVPSPDLPPLPVIARPPLKLAQVPEAAIQATRRADPALLGRLLKDLLEYAERHRLRVNKDGWLSASHIGPLARALGLEADSAPIPLPFLLDIAVQGLLMQSVDGRLRPAPDAAARLQQPPHEIIRELFTRLTQSFWIDDTPHGDPRTLYDALREDRFDDPVQSDQIAARLLMHTLLSRLSSGKGWFRVEALCSEALRVRPRLLWETRRYSYYSFLRTQADELTVQKVHRQYTFLMSYLLRTCVAFGLVDVGSLTGAFFTPTSDHPLALTQHPKTHRYTLESTGLAFRLSALGRMVLLGETSAPIATRLTVGADFEILAPLDTIDPQALYLLGQITERTPGHPDDPVARFTLRQESWVRALQSHPQSPDEIRAALATWNGGPLPANVDRTLREWAQGIHALQFIEGADLLAFDTPAARDAALAGVAGVRLVGDRFALVSGTVEPPITLPRGQKITEIDYLKPPVRCLTFALDGTVTIQAGKRDFLVDAELAPITEASSSPLKRCLTAASLRGWKSRDVLARLSSRGTLPAGLEGAVKGWCGEVAPVPAERALIVQIPPPLAADLLQHSDVAASIAGSLGEGILVVKDLRALKRALERLNIQVAGTLQTS